MASGPSVIMLDEPLSALDSYLRWQLEGELASILEEFGGVALYVSHNRDEVYRMCENVCVMSAGRSEPVRTVRDLFDSPDTLASSLLSGCKNYSRIERLGPGRVRALDWNSELECAGAVADDAAFIGVRAHYIHPIAKPGENVFSCRVVRVTQDVFQTIVNATPVGAPEGMDFTRVRMEMTREEARGICAGDVIEVGIKPQDVMLLKK
jgi:molybdate transport system ATP-binding protein